VPVATAAARRRQLPRGLHSPLGTMSRPSRRQPGRPWGPSRDRPAVEEAARAAVEEAEEAARAAEPSPAAEVDAQEALFGLTADELAECDFLMTEDGRLGDDDLLRTAEEAARATVEEAARAAVEEAEEAADEPWSRYVLEVRAAVSRHDKESVLQILRQGEALGFSLHTDVELLTEKWLKEPLQPHPDVGGEAEMPEKEVRAATEDVGDKEAAACGPRPGPRGIAELWAAASRRDKEASSQIFRRWAEAGSKTSLRLQEWLNYAPEAVMAILEERLIDATARAIVARMRERVGSSASSSGTMRDETDAERFKKRTTPMSPWAKAAGPWVKATAAKLTAAKGKATAAKGDSGGAGRGDDQDGKPASTPTSKPTSTTPTPGAGSADIRPRTRSRSRGQVGRRLREDGPAAQVMDEVPEVENDIADTKSEVPEVENDIADTKSEVPETLEDWDFFAEIAWAFSEGEEFEA